MSVTPQPQKIPDVYFDSNVFGHICELTAGINALHVKKLQEKLEQNKINIILSYLNLDEAIGAVSHSEDDAKKLVETILKYACPDKIIQHLPDYIGNQIASYANGTAPKTSFIEDSVITQQLAKLRNGEWTLDELKQIAAESKKQKTEYKFKLDEARTNIEKQIKINRKQIPSFMDFWSQNALSFAESLAESGGLLVKVKQCGMEGFLEVKSVRICIGYALSLIHENYLNGRKFKPSDSRDHQHAILASAADIFVTQEKTLTRWLKQIPGSPISAMDLPTLLENA